MPVSLATSGRRLPSALRYVLDAFFWGWTPDRIGRRGEGLREDKPAAEVRRLVPNPKPAAEVGSARPTKSARPKATTARRLR
jgi:hypothetical protein